MSFFFRIGLLYIGLGLVLGFATGGLGPILVARGFSVTQSGFAMLLFLPFGLSFLWAPLVERHNLFGQRFGGWVLAMQVFATALLAMVAFLEAAPLEFLFVLGLATTTALATMDIRLEAIVVRHVSEANRPLAGAIKIGSFSMGSVIGGGVLVATFDSLGWTNVILIIAGVLVCGAFAAIGLPRSKSSTYAGFRTVWRQDGFPGHMLTVGLMLGSFFLLFGMARIALVDIGYSLEEVGILVGVTAPLLSLPVFPIVGFAVKWAGPGPVLTAFRVLAVLTGLFWIAATLNGWLFLAIIASVAGTFTLGGIYVFVLSALLSWSDGEHPATSYALLYGGGNLAVLIPTAGAGFLASVVDWPIYYMIAILLFILASENFRRRAVRSQILSSSRIAGVQAKIRGEN